MGLTSLQPAPLALVQTPTGGQVLANKERFKRPFYDTFLTTAGVANPNPIPFFTIPIGQIGSGFAVAKTFQNCNFEKSMQLAKGRAINIEGIEISIYQVGVAAFSDVNARLIAAMWEDMHLEFLVQSDVALEARLKNFASGSGITGIPFMNAVGAQTYIAPQPTLRGVRRLARRINLPTGVRFEPRLWWNANNTLLAAVVPAGSELLIRISLFGMASRPLD